MAEKDPLVLSYVHLASYPRAGEALHTLKRIASLVKPLMRARGWKVRELAEFYPSQSNLLGLNVNRGAKICIRLRYPGDKTQFLPLEQVVDTMLHELCHNVHGPHNQAFHALWDQLRDEQQGLMMKGYTGEGFLSEGHRLGGARIPPHEARRLAREAAEKRNRQPTGTGPGRRLGGAAPRPGQDIRRVISDAVQRRNETLRGCAEGNLDERQIHDLADTATRNGFRTQAEEDEANEVAIAQAMWELVQEDEKAKRGNHGPVPPYSSPTTSTVTSNPGTRGFAPSKDSESVVAQHMWACGVCTLHNPPNFLCCNACGSERPQRPQGQQLSGAAAAAATPSADGQSTKKREPVTIDLTESVSPTRSRPGKSRRRDAARAMTTAQAGGTEAAATAHAVPEIWQCSFCGNVMEQKWWTCSTCGRMKDSS